MWIWGGGLSKAVLDDAVKHFTKPALKPQEIGGDFKAKLLTTMSGGRGMPDITGVKGEDIAAFYPQTNQFVDLNTVGADKVKAQYLDWKWAQGTAPDGTQIGIPIDIGPTALFYRAGRLRRGGAAERARGPGRRRLDVRRLLRPRRGAQGQAARPLPGRRHRHHLRRGRRLRARSSTSTRTTCSSATRTTSATAWDTAVKAFTLGIDGRVQRQQRPQRRVDQRHAAAHIGAAWDGLDIASACPDSSGKWRVAANPGGPANIGGSFLTIPKSSRRPGAGLRGHLLDPQPGERGPRVRRRVAVPGHPVVVRHARADQAATRSSAAR